MNLQMCNIRENLNLSILEEKRKKERSIDPNLEQLSILAI